MQKGSASIAFEAAPCICSAAAIVGKKEGEGPLGALFDQVEQDPLFGCANWEEAESELQRRTAKLAMKKAGVDRKQIRYLFSGDLLGQLIATSFGTADFEIPLFGLYGACSTMGEALCLGAMTVAAGYADQVLAMASSHFASAEKQFRFPLEYGNQRPYSATWTVTGCGAAVVGKSGGVAKITGVTIGKIVDMGLKDSMNMGACMAPAALDTLLQHLRDFERTPQDYDQIITGDLGEVGRRVLLDLAKARGAVLSERYMDCGIRMFDSEKQDTHAGGSGCGCSACVLSAYVLPKIQSGEWKRVLFIPTGALLSSTSFNEGQSVPGIAHAVVIEHIEREV